MLKKITISLLLSAGLVSGCSTTFIDQLIPEDEFDYEEMYVRGVFTWWEADENYRLKRVGENLFAATAKLIADGQPYDFKFADRNWTPGLSCGSIENNENVDLELTTKVLADCDNPQGNFKFTPDETGTYSFLIDFNVLNKPQVYIERVD